MELTFEKRFSDNWQGLINYTLSRGYGNMFNDFGSQLFDFPDENCRVTTIGTVPCASVLNTNRFGIAPYDRTHVLNFFSAYTWSWPVVNLTAAPAFTWFSGLPYQRTRTVVVPSGATGINTYFDPRGSSRLPSTYQLDFALEATFKPAGNAALGLIGGPLEIGVKGEVFNLTNQQETIRTDRIELRPSEGEPHGAAGSIFGAPTSRTAQQLPRAFRFTGFIRF